MQNKKEIVLPPVIVAGMSRVDEKRLDELYSQNYCKQETNNMKLNEFMMFVLDKGLLGTKLNLQFFYDDYCKTVAEDEDQTIQVQMMGKKMSVTQITKPQPQKEIEKGQNRLTKNKFLFFIDRIGKKMFQSNKKSLEMVLKEVLKERQVSKGNTSGEVQRVMIFDEINKRILTERPIQTLLTYQKQIKILFVLYQPQNYVREELMLEWDEIRLLNLNLPIYQLIQLLNDANLFPGIISAELIEDVLVKILPASVPKEHQFYQGENLAKICEKIATNKWKPVAHEGDPKLSYFDFQMSLARFAMEIAQKELTLDVKKDMAIPLIKFLQDQLGLSSDSLPLDITRKHLQLIQAYLDKIEQNIKLELEKELALDTQTIEPLPQSIQEKNLEIVMNLPEQMDLIEIIGMIQNEFPPLPIFNSVDSIAQRQRKLYEDHARKMEEAKKREEDKLNKKVNKQAPKQSAKDKEPKREISLRLQY